MAVPDQNKTAGLLVRFSASPMYDYATSGIRGTGTFNSSEDMQGIAIIELHEYLQTTKNNFIKIFGEKKSLSLHPKTR